ncbi:MAG: purine-nucleoside/S-methyl-5-thioadenosine phosphorylase / adenosine deaminase [Phycisphaerales bacterium]|jgi:YfiH family protein|nr:purine-nucleoside/S-methyl-5-thioadenosine phosphorylase / adenosine deaminase [Phycisphaerales bacterium]
MERRAATNGVVYYVSPLLERLGVRHAFSTRLGGKSPPPFDSLNLGNPSGCAEQDDYGRIYENYDLLQHAIGVGGRTRCWVHQVHGGTVVEVNGAFECGVKADAMVTEDVTKILAVRVADCVPVLLATEDGMRVAAVHAGWRGVIASIVQIAVDRLKTRERTNVVAAIGPAISYEAFEVGMEVIEQFHQQFGSDAPVRERDDGKGHVDLRAAITLQLLAAGLTAENIDLSDRCTFRDFGEFFSHRRERGVTGRMAALISPAGSAG